jgi:hypothetical protein
MVSVLLRTEGGLIAALGIIADAMSDINRRTSDFATPVRLLWRPLSRRKPDCWVFRNKGT